MAGAAGHPLAAGANAPVLILPDMARALGVSGSTATWLVASYAWAMAVGTPLLAGLLRRRGLRAVLRVASALLVGGTLLVAASPGCRSPSPGGPRRPPAARASRRSP